MPTYSATMMKRNKKTRTGEGIRFLQLQKTDLHSLTRKLDDSELDSGDDEGRADRVAATVEDEDIIDDEKELKLLNTEMVRVKPPEGDEV